LRNRRTIKTGEQAFRYFTFKTQWHKKCYPIIATPIYLLSTEENAQEPTKITFYEFGCAYDWVSQLIHPNPAILQY